MEYLDKLNPNNEPPFAAYRRSPDVIAGRWIWQNPSCFTYRIAHIDPMPKGVDAFNILSLTHLLIKASCLFYFFRNAHRIESLAASWGFEIRGWNIPLGLCKDPTVESAILVTFQLHDLRRSMISNLWFVPLSKKCDWHDKGLQSNRLSFPGISGAKNFGWISCAAYQKIHLSKQMTRQRWKPKRVISTRNTKTDSSKAGAMDFDWWLFKSLTSLRDPSWCAQ